MGAPLEDARHLAQRYDRMRQEAEAQVFLNQTLIFVYDFSICGLIWTIIVSLRSFLFSLHVYIVSAINI